MDQELDDDDLIDAVIGAGIEVHQTLGAGFQELTYERALAVELRRRGIRFRQQVRVTLTYKDEPIGDGALDFLIDERLVLELKAIDRLSEAHVRQVLTYLYATERRLGLLMNFHEARLVDGLRRVSR